MEEMSHFFKVYKELEGKATYVMDVQGPEEAKQIIKKSIEAYKEKFKK